MDTRHERRTAKNGEIRLRSKLSVTHILWRLLKIALFLIIAHVIGFVAFLIPLIGWIFSIIIGAISWLIALLMLISLLIYCFSHTVITSDGIYGRDKLNRSFDVCFDQIQRFERNGTKIIIGSDELKKDGDIRQRVHVIPMINSVEFEQAYLNR
ncbi:MAG: hypothetical protein IJF08_07715 [Clostridia bacterium]|nr:hypothetical protein [Clostridia bacterium]